MPKMTKHAGAVWKSYPLEINGFPHLAYMDINHGRCFYFAFDDKWYRVPVVQYVNKIDYRLDPRTGVCKLTTKP
jgi:hypothetical protein